MRKSIKLQFVQRIIRISFFVMVALWSITLTSSVSAQSDLRSAIVGVWGTQDYGIGFSDDGTVTLLGQAASVSGSFQLEDHILTISLNDGSVWIFEIVLINENILILLSFDGEGVVTYPKFGVTDFPSVPLSEETAIDGFWTTGRSIFEFIEEGILVDNQLWGSYSITDNEFSLVISGRYYNGSYVAIYSDEDLIVLYETEENYLLGIMRVSGNDEINATFLVGIWQNIDGSYLVNEFRSDGTATLTSVYQINGIIGNYEINENFLTIETDLNRSTTINFDTGEPTRETAGLEIVGLGERLLMLRDADNPNLPPKLFLKVSDELPTTGITASLIGMWRSSSGVTLTLNEDESWDGEFPGGDYTGEYRLIDNVMILTSNAGQQVYEVIRLDRYLMILTLDGQYIVFARVGGS